MKRELVQMPPIQQSSHLDAMDHAFRAGIRIGGWMGLLAGGLTSFLLWVIL